MNLLEKHHRQVQFLLFLNYLPYATIRAEILAKTEFWSEPLQL